MLLICIGAGCAVKWYVICGIKSTFDSKFVGEAFLCIGSCQQGLGILFHNYCDGHPWVVKK